MEYPVHLLTVEARFQVTGRGLIVMPHLDCPRRFFSPFRTMVAVRIPGGQEQVEPVLFSMSHFTFADAAGKWVIEVILKGATKESVPVGSKLFASVEDAKTLGVVQG
jgi:hypothetical protein